MITFITGTGTLILPYSLVFNNHIPSGVLMIIGLTAPFKGLNRAIQAFYPGSNSEYLLNL